jgi:hypothetical protein
MLDGQEKRLSSDNAWDNWDRLHRLHHIHKSTGNTFPNPVDNQSGDEEIPIAKTYHLNSLFEDKSLHRPNWALLQLGPVGHSCLLKDDRSYPYLTISSFYEFIRKSKIFAASAG